ncbi:GntR family transcriptional regulator [Xanthobacter sediminis]
MTQPSPQPLGAGHTRYMALAQALIDDITSGRYAVGALLPTEHELSAHFGVSRHTVREAIRRLSELGLVTRQPGVGTRVRALRGASRYVHSSTGMGDLFQYVRDVRLVLEQQIEIIADEELADLLECRPGQAWLKVAGERRVAGEEQPIALTQVYIDWAYRDVLDGVSTPDLPLYAMIEQRYGIVATEVRQQISAVAIDEESAAALGVEPGTAGLRVIRKYLNAAGEIFEVAVNLHPGDRFSHSMTMRLESGSTPGRGA